MNNLTHNSAVRPQYKSHHDGKYVYSFALRTEKNHLFVDIQGIDWLLDTGAPSSFGKKHILIGERSFTVPSSNLGMTAEQLTDFVDHPTSGIIGTDVLNNFDILIDTRREKISFSKSELLFEGEALEMTSIMGIPTIEANISGSNRKMVFDTGAKISYFQDESLSTFPVIDTVSDFYPGIGQFQTETYRVNVALGAITLELCCGSLPDLLGMTLTMTGAKGIIGNEILNDHVIGYFPRRQTLVIA